MDKIDFEHLELLLSKLQYAIGTRVCIIPNYVHDGCYIATYKENGEVDKQVTSFNLEDAFRKLNSEPEDKRSVATEVDSKENEGKIKIKIGNVKS